MSLNKNHERRQTTLKTLTIERNVTSVLLYFFGPSGSLMPSLLSAAQAGAGGVRDVALIHYPSCTNSIKPGLQFLRNIVVINASEGSLCFQIFILSNKSSVIAIHIRHI
jgi:hypothetical protein